MAVTTQMPRRAHVLALTLLCALGAITAVRAGEQNAGDAFAALLVGLAVLASELRPLHAARGGERRTFTFAEGPFVVGLAVSNGVLLVVALAAGVLFSQLIRRLPPIKLAFNVAQYGLAASLASLIAQQVDSGAGVVVGMLVFAAVNDVAVQLVLLLVTGAPVRLPFWDRAGSWFAHLAAATTGALLLRDVVDTDQTLVLAFVVPLFLIWYSQLKSLRQILSEQVLTTIARHAPESRPGGRRGVLSLVTACARELMASQRAGVIVLDGPRPLLAEDTAGALAERRLGSDWYAAESDWRAVLDAGAVGLVKGHRAAIVLAGAGRTVGLLYVERAVTEEPFRPDDRKALRELARHAGEWLAEAGAAASAEPLQVIELDQPVSTANPQLLGLLAELDVLRSRLTGVAPGTVGASLEHEVDELQRRLVDVIAGRVAPEEPGQAVEVGRWPVWSGLGAVGALQ